MPNKTRYAIKEKVTLSSGKAPLEEKVMRLTEGEIPAVIYPEIRVITASKVTRNKTFYPYSSLKEDKIRNSGYPSMLYPYNIPVIKDHAIGRGLLGGSSDIYGRVKYARYIGTETSGFVSAIPAITDPEAIEKILTERFLTVSIGAEAEEVYCSICGLNPCEDGGCDHQKGKTYPVDGVPTEAYWKIGPVWFQEISFVTIPSDDEAMVINKNTQLSESFNILGAETEKKGELIFTESFNDLREMWGLSRKPVVKEAPNKKSIVKSKDLKEEKTAAPLAEYNEASTVASVDVEEDLSLVMGELFGPDKNDPEYKKEAALTKKQRDALPDSAFCGPDRTFPIVSLGHAKFALSVLPRYKGPGDKDKIKACILRKAQQLKKKESTTLSGTPLAILIDDKYGVEIPLFPVNKENIYPIYSSIQSSNLPYKEELFGGLLKFCSDNKLPKPKELASITLYEENYPLQIKLDERSYPLLYNYIDTMEQYVLEVSMENNILEVASDEATDLASKSTPPVVEEHTVTEAVVNSTEFVSVDEAAKIKAENQSLKEELISLSENIKIMNEKAIELAQAHHLRLAHEVALLSKILKRSIAREKSLDVVTNELAKRTTQSLEDALKDLLLDFNGSAPINVEMVEKIENPVLQTNDQENVTKIVTDPKTGKPTLDTAITEEEEDSVYIHFLGPEKLAAIKSRYNSQHE